MPSFRARVLDALDIHKKTVKLQVNERFPKVYSDSGTAGTGLVGTTAEYDRGDHCDYAVSKEIRSTIIGPNTTGGGVKQTLDCLGFVVGQPAAGGMYKNMYPVTCPEEEDAITAADIELGESHATHYTGFHSLGGLYDAQSKELKSMRKSAMPVMDLDSAIRGAGTAVTEHAHKDWPDNVLDQTHLLNENPWADSLYYHSTRLSFLLTGLTIPDNSEKASNHRGLVRMLVLRPRLPSVRTRWSGSTGQPELNMAYPPHFDTDLFYSKRKTLGGRLDADIDTRDTTDADHTHLTPSFGLIKYANPDPSYNLEAGSDAGTAGSSTNLYGLHYGHPIPDEGTAHDLTSYDILTAPINREKYAVIVDKMVHLDTLHHGVASKRIENLVIPYNKKVKFGGRKPLATSNTTAAATNMDGGTGTAHLSSDTFNEPLNFENRPIIMFLSMDQKISCQVTGYTTISEC